MAAFPPFDQLQHLILALSLDQVRAFPSSLFSSRTHCRQWWCGSIAHTLVRVRINKYRNRVAQVRISSSFSPVNSKLVQAGNFLVDGNFSRDYTFSPSKEWLAKCPSWDKFRGFRVPGRKLKLES
ncbi:uncharacterized protein LOC112341220 isoform X1 [Selaginella moellendorffii]|uniref:uncharacterized protein LOC112341220 isoform X1 n=1 Tax=Selaginella moellendorffii TaxID=88036 RepID=UPI000D1C6BA6|nr:uncharacterized protein LOC112341220 isoform X1 [Selaginella moellendorffii]|eukprot:XP_024516785.1 uncharacterized protein LOC112341220 isoform X1 [Selaginella moellendorffii]